MKKTEKIFILSILLFAILLWGGLSLFGSHDYGSVRIEVNGEEFGTYSLAEDQVISINDTNVCEIKDGQISMTDASCPDHLCIKQGAIGSSGGMIVCLPNKVVVEGIKAENAAEPEVDAVS